MMLKWCCRRQCWNTTVENVVKKLLQKMLLQKTTCAFVANKCTSTIFFLSFCCLCPLAKKMMMSIVLIIIFWCFYETRAKENDECASLSSFGFFHVVFKWYIWSNIFEVYIEPFDLRKHSSRFTASAWIYAMIIEKIVMD
jgi:hypothetical protein